MNRVFILGDSTAAPKEEAARPETGWGECFSPFLDSSWVLENRAVNGRSTKLALSNGDFFNALASCCEGDAALIQYGHNESKPDEERHTEPWTSFKDNLTYMANAFRKKGALFQTAGFPAVSVTFAILFSSISIFLLSCSLI